MFRRQVREQKVPERPACVEALLPDAPEPAPDAGKVCRIQAPNPRLAGVASGGVAARRGRARRALPGGPTAVPPYRGGRGARAPLAEAAATAPLAPACRAPAT